VVCRIWRETGRETIPVSPRSGTHLV